MARGFIRRTDGQESIVSGGEIELIADVDITIIGNVQAGDAISFHAGESLGTVGEKVLMEVSAVNIDAASSVVLDGAVSDLTSLDITSYGNVSLLANKLERNGLTVTSKVLSQQQQLLWQLASNLKSQLALQNTLNELRCLMK